MAKRIKVVLSRQILIATEDGKEAFRFDCATGDSDHRTDPGVFSIFQKDRKHFSHKYKVEMDYAMFFTHDGKAIHMSHAVGLTSLLKSWGVNSLGSHGCVRLSEEDAQALFDWTPMGTVVEVASA